MTLMKNANVEKLGFLIHDTARLMRKRFQEKSSEYGLSAAQWRLLFRLFKEEGVPQARLAELLEIEPISVSRLIDRMAEGGWVERRQGTTDRRVRMVYATAKARSLFGDVKQVATVVYDEALAGMSEHEQLELVRLLKQMADNLGAPVGECPVSGRSGQEGWTK
ncbi:MarR family winged helix-turn-helix transcriptional regulator [Nitratireductor indicus]|uniref:Transcriptional regulator n=1 Tax=Nitratireductor indicus C115 TaxID=1231190 RepID=K2N9E9_9HYPH|nr:MarR family transcriptional regulator [Nitratireductor indicus]EKF44103.1 transcriptional regulator [Nitratireductor indicus C115]MDS1137061.1 MarR family transcriptional regulator [Nitratireductor indicus]SFQ23370.1 DNA-binding transcriptional regulator, MarR family [Nitratireductor indicus]